MQFPLKDVEIKRVSKVPMLADPLYVGAQMQINPDCCRLEISGIGACLIAHGREIAYAPYPGVDPRIAEAQLWGLPLAALLHQREILHFHASSIIWEEMGILVFGQSGAGKSSLSAAFLKEGARTLSDDLSPIDFVDKMPVILPMAIPLRLRPEVAEQLHFGKEDFENAVSYTDKCTLKPIRVATENFPLHRMIYLEKHDGNEFLADIPAADEQFALLRSEICHWEMLRGMPQVEKKYMGRILQILNHMKLLRIRRPQHCKVQQLLEFVKNEIQK